MKESPELFRARILNGAIALFSSKGIEHATTRELTEQLGISRSHIYHYFRDWETLCKEAMAHFMQQDREEFTRALSGTAPQQQLALFVTSYLPIAHEASWQLYSSLWQLAIHDEEWAQMAQLMLDQWQALLAEIVTKGIAAGEFAHPAPLQFTRQLGALLNGYADQLIIAPSPASHQAAMADIEAFIALALRGGRSFTNCAPHR